MQEKLRDNKMQESSSLFVKLGDVVEIAPKVPKMSPDTEVSFLGMVDISTEGTIINNHRCKYSEVSKGYSKFLEGDILVAKIGGCFDNGKGVLATGLINGVGFGSTEFHVLRATKKINPYILFNITLSKSFRAKGKLEETGSTHKRVPLSFIENYQIFLPPLPEQQKIASILRTWDKAIEETKKLIALNEKSLKVLMKILFEECIALKNSDWSFTALGEIFTERQEYVVEDMQLLAITGTEGIVKRSSLKKRDTSSKDKSKYRLICSGDIGYNTMRMWQGVCGLSSLLGIVSPAYTICIPDNSKINPLFVSFLFKFPRMVNEFYRYSQGLVDDTLGLKFSHFEEIKIYLPPMKYQNKAAVVLSNYKNKISALKKYCAALQNQKQGLMQKLLTGQWRVKVNEEVK
ncbi:MAG: restriction endonuclease subunit S [Rickettsia endosymbiont of Oxypoda opaca]|nr:restriction endonuclease subunit S [Rickettsia endosymbiont of Oxypoda opaca]